MPTKVVRKSKAVEKTRSGLKNRKAAKLLRSWLSSDGGYDARVWSQLEKGLKEDRFRLRDHDESTS